MLIFHFCEIYTVCVLSTPFALTTEKYLFSLAAVEERSENEHKTKQKHDKSVKIVVVIQRKPSCAMPRQSADRRGVADPHIQISSKDLVISPQISFKCYPIKKMLILLFSVKLTKKLLMLLSIVSS